MSARSGEGDVSHRRSIWRSTARVIRMLRWSLEWKTLASARTVGLGRGSVIDVHQIVVDLGHVGVLLGLAVLERQDVG